MGRRADRRPNPLDVDVGVLEEAERRLQLEDSGDRVVDARFGEVTGLDEVPNVGGVLVAADRDQVEPRVNGRSRRIPLRRRHAVVLVEMVDPAPVRGDGTVEPEPFAQEFDEVPPGTVGRLAVDRVVTRHHDRRPGVDGPGERRDEQPVDRARRAIHRRGVLAARGVAVGGEVFRRRGDPRAVRLRLESANGRAGERATEQRALAEGLEGAAPARIASHVAGWAVVQICTRCTHLRSCDLAGQTRVRRVSGRCDAQTVREHRRPVDVRVAVDGVDGEQQRDSVVRLLYRDSL